MRQNNLLVQVRRFCRTTIPGEDDYPNLLLGLVIDHPDQVWCGDITYIRLGNGFAYLAVLMDAYARAIRGWELSVRALEKALHHSDHGVQYLSEGYISLLKDAGVEISMAARGKAWENGYAERLMGCTSKRLQPCVAYIKNFNAIATAQNEHLRGATLELLDNLTEFSDDNTKVLILCSATHEIDPQIRMYFEGIV